MRERDTSRGSRARGPMALMGLTLATMSALLLGCRTQQADIATRLVSPDPMVRDQVNLELMRMGPRAVPMLQDMVLSARDPQVRTRAVEGLAGVGNTGPEAAQAVIQALVRILAANPDPEIRQLMIYLLRSAGPWAIPSLADMAVRMPARTGAQEPSPGIDLVAVMLNIDRRLTIEYLIALLSVDEYSRYQGNIMECLRLITKQQDAVYGPGASAEERKKAIEAWHEWWQREGALKGGR